MLRGHTPKDRANIEEKMTTTMKESLGKDFVAKLKSNRRHEYRDYRKESGQGDASLRRFKKTKENALKKAKQ